MSDESDKEMDLSRKVWLAGIGAYGRAFGEAQEVYTKMGKETSKAFEELVGRGEDLESKVATAAKHYAPKVASETVKSTVDGFNGRLDRMKATLGLTEVAAQQHDQLNVLHERMDNMDSKLDEILAGVKAITLAQSQASTTSTSTSAD